MFLKAMDMLSPKITLYYKRKDTHASAISGFFTIISYIVIITFGVIYFIRYIKRENPTAYSFNRYVNDAGIFSFIDSNFFNYIQLLKMGEWTINEIDFKKVEIVGINTTFETYINTENKSAYPQWIYGTCDEGINIKKNGLENLINTDIFYKSACIKKFYNPNTSEFYDINDKNFEWPVIKHGASNQNFTYFGILIKRCQNTSFRLENFGECSSDKEINEYLNRAFLTFSVVNHYIDILNYKNPISKHLYSITNKIEIDSYVTNNLNFRPALITSYDILFSNDKDEKTTYIFHQNSQATAPTRDSNLLGVFFFWLQNSQQYYERRYQKLQEVLSDIGGFGSIIIMLAKFLNYLFYSFTMLFDTKQLISIVLKNDNNTINAGFRNFQNISKLIEENNDNQNEEDKNIKIFETRTNFNKMKNSENSEDKNEYVKIIRKRINIINKNLGEETNRMNKSKEISEPKIIKRPKSGAFEEIKTRYIKNYIKLNFNRIDQNEYFSRFDYLCYMIFCKKIKSKIKYYEDLRRLIISEEIMFQNYLNINHLLEFHQFN